MTISAVSTSNSADEARRIAALQEQQQRQQQAAAKAKTTATRPPTGHPTQRLAQEYDGESRAVAREQNARVQANPAPKQRSLPTPGSSGGSPAAPSSAGSVEVARGVRVDQASGKVTTQRRDSAGWTSSGAAPVAENQKRGASNNPLQSVGGWFKDRYQDAKHNYQDNQANLDHVKTWLGGQGAEIRETLFDKPRERLDEIGRQGGAKGAAAQYASFSLGVDEGFVLGAKDAVVGVFGLAEGAHKLGDPMEWATNPGANLARIETTVAAADALGTLASPTSMALGLRTGKTQNIVGSLWSGISEPYRKGDVAQGIGRGVFDIGSLFVGPGEVSAFVKGAGSTRSVAGAASHLANIGTGASRELPSALDVFQKVGGDRLPTPLRDLLGGDVPGVPKTQPQVAELPLAVDAPPSRIPAPRVPGDAERQPVLVGARSPHEHVNSTPATGPGGAMTHKPRVSGSTVDPVAPRGGIGGYSKAAQGPGSDGATPVRSNGGSPVAPNDEVKSSVGPSNGQDGSLTSSGRHTLVAWVERDGRVLRDNIFSVQSGGLTKNQAGPYGLNSHTEPAYYELTAVKGSLREGDIVRMIGSRDPCLPGCRPYLVKAAHRDQVTIIYDATDTGLQWTFRPPGFDEHRGFSNTIVEVKDASTGDLVEKRRYWMTTSGNWTSKRL